MRTNILHIIAALLVVLVLVSMMPRSEGFSKQTKQDIIGKGKGADRMK